MMKKSMLMMSAVLTLCLAVLASCNSSNDDNKSAITDQALPGCFNKIVAPDGTTTYDDEVSYSLLLDFGKKTGTLKINGLKEPGGMSYATITIPDLPFTIKDNVKTIEVPAMNATANGTLVNITGLKFRLMDRIVGMFNYPMLYVSYTLNDRYQVMSTRKNIVFWGETKSTSPEGKESKTTASYYEIVYNPKTVTADINIYNAQFVAAMPQMNMTFASIPFDFSDERVSLNCASLVPTIGTTPYPNFPISDLKGEMDMFKDLTIDFGCDFKGADYKVNFKGAVTDYYSK